MKVVIEGGLGDASTRLYIPNLDGLIKDGITKIYLIDIIDRWVAEEQIPHRKEFEVINKSKTPGSSKLESLNDISFVCIATPPDTHFVVARYWIGKTPKIVIEKPATVSKRDFKDLKKAAQGSLSRLYFYDHYRFKLANLLNKIDKTLSISKRNIKSIECELIECFSIEERKRVSAFAHGVSYDLFPHCFSMLDLLGVRDQMDIKSKYSAVYKHSAPAMPTQTDNETYARITGLIGSVSFNLVVAIGCKESRKMLTIKFEGGIKLVYDIGNQLFKIFDGEDIIMNDKIRYSPYQQLLSGLVNSVNFEHKLFQSWESTEKIISNLEVVRERLGKTSTIYELGSNYEAIESGSDQRPVYESRLS